MLLVMQTPKAGREAEHRDWYLSTHLPDICAVPGVLHGEYMRLADGVEPSGWTNAAVYWLDGDPAAILDEIFRRVAAGGMKLSDTLDPDNTLMTIAVAATPRIVAPGDSASSEAGRGLYIVLTNATSGDDAIFNSWYSDTHIADVLDVPGFTAAQRFQLVDHPALKRYPYRYLALYEIAANATEAALAELSVRAGTERMIISPTLDTTTVHAVAFSTVGSYPGSA